MGPIEQLDRAVRHAQAGGKVQSIQAGMGAMVALFGDFSAKVANKITIPLKGDTGCTFRGIPIASNPDMPTMNVAILMEGGKIFALDLVV